MANRTHSLIALAALLLVAVPALAVEPGTWPPDGPGPVMPPAPGDSSSSAVFLEADFGPKSDTANVVGKV